MRAWRDLNRWAQIATILGAPIAVLAIVIPAIAAKRGESIGDLLRQLFSADGRVSVSTSFTPGPTAGSTSPSLSSPSMKPPIYRGGGAPVPSPTITTAPPPPSPTP